MQDESLKFKSISARRHIVEGESSMKTITFYSYKGGTGRTLSLANLAMCLSRLGENVCVLDFDLEAPGLHHKFAGYIKEEEITRGVADYLWKYIESGHETFPESIEDYAYQIRPGTGTIHLIPAGNMESEEYWQKLADPRFHQIFWYMPDPSPAGKKSADNLYARCLNSFERMRNIKGRIENLTPSPTYLLIDSRSGKTGRGNFCTYWLADTVVCLLLSNHESQQGIRLMLREESRFSSETFSKHLNVVCALTRIPHIDDQEAQKLKKEICEYLNEPSKDPQRRDIKDICILHSDRELELKEELRIKAEGSIDEKLLSYEYINLFNRIIPEMSDQFVKLGKMDSVAKKVVELEESPEVRARLFALYIKEGIMVNPADKKRNISFKVVTIQNMFTAVYQDLLKKEQEQFENVAKATEETEKAFFHAGVTCGESFGKELVDEVWKDEGELSLQEKLTKWGEFDSSVGFGKFSHKIEQGDVISGKIMLSNNFLAANRKSTEPNLCDFMTGYIQGVLKELIKGEIKVTVTHKEGDCIQHQQGKKECDFYFRSVE